MFFSPLACLTPQREFKKLRRQRQINDLIGWMRKSCGMCGTLLVQWSSLPNDDVNFSYSRFWRQHEPAAVNRELKKLRWLLEQKVHIKTELCVRLSVLRLFHVGHVVQNRRCALSLAWHESSKMKVLQTTSKNSTKKCAARVPRLFFLIQPIKSLIGGVVVVTSYKLPNLSFSALSENHSCQGS